MMPKPFFNIFVHNFFALSCATIRSLVMLSGASIQLGIESDGSRRKGFVNVVVNVDKILLTSALTLFILESIKSECKCC